MAKDKKKKKIDLGTTISAAVQSAPTTAKEKPTTRNTIKRDIRTTKTENIGSSFNKQSGFNSSDSKDIRTVKTEDTKVQFGTNKDFADETKEKQQKQKQTKEKQKDGFNVTKDKLKLWGKGAQLGLLGGTTHALDAPVQTVQSELEKGKKLDTPKKVLEQAALTLSDPTGYATAGKNARERIERDKTKKKNDALSTLSTILPFLKPAETTYRLGADILGTDNGYIKNSVNDTLNNFQYGLETTNPVVTQAKNITQLVGAAAKKHNLDEKIKAKRDILYTPLNEHSIKHAKELEGQDKTTKRVDTAFQAVGNMLPSIATSVITKNPDIGLGVMAASARGAGTREAELAYQQQEQEQIQKIQQMPDGKEKDAEIAKLNEMRKTNTLDKAIQIGNARAAIEVGTEKLFGGDYFLGKGTLDDVISGTINKKVRNKGLNFLAKNGFNVAGEIPEEITSDILGTLIDRGTIDPDATYTKEDLIETITATGISTAILNFISGGYSRRAYRQNALELEQYKQNQLNQQSTTTNLNEKINDAPTQNLENSVNQVNQLIEKANSGEITMEQANQQMEQINNGTYQQNRNLEEIANFQVQQIQQAVSDGKMSPEQGAQEIQAVNLTLDAERERINPTQQTEEQNTRYAQTEEVQQEQTQQQQEVKPIDTDDKIQNFRNSVENEHIEDADGFYKAAEKIIKDKDYNVIMDSSITNKEGKTVNALIQTDENGEVTIKINPKSERAGEILLMHEVTHGIETKQMRNLIMDFAKKNEGFNEALEDLKKAYGTEDVSPEVVADISGQLFGNQEFIDSLSTENPTLFKRIHDLIVSLKNKLTGNSKYDNFVKDLAVKYEKAYRKANKQTARENINEATKYATDDFEDEIGDDPIQTTLAWALWNYEIGGYLNNEDFMSDVKNYDEFIKKLEEHDVYDIPNADDIINDITYTRDIDLNEYYSKDEIDTFLNMNFKDFVENIINDGLDTSNFTIEGIDSEPEISEKFKEKSSKQKRDSKMSNSVDNQGNKLSKKQVIYFDESKVRDENGNLIKVYHTNKYQDLPFYQFKPQGAADYHSELFGDQTVIFASDDATMSGSYAYDNYFKADTKRYTKLSEIQEFLDKLNEINTRKNNNWVVKKAENNKYIIENTNGKTGTYRFNPETGVAESNVISFDSKDDLMRNWKNKLAENLNNDSERHGNEFNKEKWQYEGYLNIENPYKIDAEGRYWHEVSYEISEKAQKFIDEIDIDTIKKLKNLADESEKKHNDFIGNKSMESRLIDQIVKEINYNEVWDILTTPELMENIDNYETLYKEVKNYDPDAQIPEPDAIMGNVSDVEDLYDEYDEYYVDKYAEMSFKDFLEEFAKYKELFSNSSEPYSWFEKNYNDIIDEKHNIFPPAILYKVAKSGFSGTELSRALKDRGGAFSLSTNDIAQYILQENQTNLKDKKYDGIIIENVIDYGGNGPEYYGSKPHNVYIFFNSNQFKAADNLDPTSDPDMRYSKRAPKWLKWVEGNFKNEGTTTNLKDKIKKTTKKQVTKEKTKEAVNNFKEAKKGKLKQRSFPITATEATGDQELLSKADKKALEYQVQTNEASYKRAKKNLEGKTYQQRVDRVLDKLNSDKKITLNDVVEAQIVLLEASQSKQTNDYLNILQDLSIMQTELGQMVQAASMIQKMSPDGQIAMLNKMINRQQAMNNKIYEGVELKPDKVQKVLDAYDDASHTTFNQEKLDNAMEELTQDVQDQMNVTIGEKINSWRYLSMLGNFKTHIRNVVANGAMFAVNKFKNTQSAALQDIFIKDKGNKTRTLKRASKDVKAFTKQAYEEVFSNSNNVGNKYTDKRGLEAGRKIFRGKNIVSKGAEFLRKTNENALTAEDQKAKQFTFNDSFSNYLTAQGINTKADIEAHPEIIQAAKAFALDEANRATFNQDNKLAQWLNDVDKKLGTPGQVIRGAIIPFTRTPLNIAKTGIEYTPGVGWFFGAAEWKRAPKNMRGNILINNISKQITGTSLALVGFALSQAGVLTGDSGDDKEDKFEKDMGAKMDYSIKIGGTNYDLSWLSPSSMPLFVGARMNEVLVKQEGIDPNFVIEGLVSTLDPLSEMSCLSGFTKVLKSYKQDSAGMFQDMSESTARNYVSQFLPTLLGQFSQAIDTKKRSTYPDKNSTFTFGQKTLRELAYKTPARLLLPEQTNYYGEAKKEEENHALRAIKAFFSPVNTKKDTMSEDSKELLRLYKKTGDDDVIPTGLQAYINYNDNKYDMSQKEYNAYKKDYGDAFQKNLHTLMNSTYYRNASDTEKADMVAGIMKYSKDKAKDNYLTDKGEDYIKVNENGTTSYYESDKVDNLTNDDFGIADYYVYKTKAPSVVSGRFDTVKNKISMVQAFDLDPMTYNEYLEGIGDIEADYTASGKLIRNSKKKKVAAFLNDLDLDPTQRAALFRQQYKSYRAADSEITNYIINSNLSQKEKESLASFLKFNVKE